MPPLFPLSLICSLYFSSHLIFRILRKLLSHYHFVLWWEGNQLYIYQYTIPCFLFLSFFIYISLILCFKFLILCYISLIYCLYSLWSQIIFQSLGLNISIIVGFSSTVWWIVVDHLPHPFPLSLILKNFHPIDKSKSSPTSNSTPLVWHKDRSSPGPSGIPGYPGIPGLN